MNKSVGNYYALDSNTAMEDYLLKDELGVDYPIVVRYFYLSSEFNETSGGKLKRG